MNSDIDNTNIEPSGDFAKSIRDFRSAVTHVAERETAIPATAGWLAPARKRRRSTQQRIALGWACAALLCFATLPFSSHSHHSATVNPVAAVTTVPAEPSAESDTALLEQVDSDVSESVPSSLAPLTELDNWNTASANPSSDSSENGTTLRQTESTNVAQ
jgi:hypothetical protein